MSDASTDATSHSAPDADWFEDWFASDFYLKLYSHRDHHEAEECVDLILRTIGSASPLADGQARRRALDLASGPGRHAIALAQRGFDVTAVDLSATLIEHARAEAIAAGVNITFLQSDMRAIEFNGEFDLGVQLFTSFGYFDNESDDMLVLQHMRSSLRQGGFYALDLINTRWLERNIVQQSARDFEDISVIERRWIESGRVNKSIEIPWRGATMRFKESVRLFSPDQIDHMLRACGLAPEIWYGDYDGSAYDADTSKRMLVISRAV